MSWIPEEELKNKLALNLAPMIDLLFLLLLFFATLAVTRMNTRDTEIDLVALAPENQSKQALDNLEEYKIVQLSITADGKYKWSTRFEDIPLSNANEIEVQLEKEYEQGYLPKDKNLTHVMLKIDKNAKWEPILRAVFAVRDKGFSVHPVYEPEEVERNES